MSRDDLNSSTLLRMAVEVIVNRSHDAPLQSVSTALAGTVWETMQEGLHAATLFGRTRLCGIQQGTVGEAGVLKKTGRSEGVAHRGAHGLQGKQDLWFPRPLRISPQDVPGKKLCFTHSPSRVTLAPNA